jgi:hypothetical protein
MMLLAVMRALRQRMRAAAFLDGSRRAVERPRRNVCGRFRRVKETWFWASYESCMLVQPNVLG